MEFNFDANTSPTLSLQLAIFSQASTMTAAWLQWWAAREGCTSAQIPFLPADRQAARPSFA